MRNFQISRSLGSALQTTEHYRWGNTQSPSVGSRLVARRAYRALVGERCSRRTRALTSQVAFSPVHEIAKAARGPSRNIYWCLPEILHKRMLGSLSSLMRALCTPSIAGSRCSIRQLEIASLRPYVMFAEAGSYSQHLWCRAVHQGATESLIALWFPVSTPDTTASRKITNKRRHDNVSRQTDQHENPF